MRDFSQDHQWLSINTATVRKSRGVDMPLTEIIEACARRGIRAISPLARPGSRGGVGHRFKAGQDPRPCVVEKETGYSPSCQLFSQVHTQGISTARSLSLLLTQWKH